MSLGWSCDKCWHWLSSKRISSSISLLWVPHNLLVLFQVLATIHEPVKVHFEATFSLDEVSDAQLWVVDLSVP